MTTIAATTRLPLAGRQKRSDAAQPDKRADRRLEKRFAELVDEYLVDLTRYATWLCRDPHLADDLVQETFLRAWRSFSKLRDRAATKSWLITILRREFLRTFERKTLPMTDLEDLEIADETALDPEDRIEIRQLRQAVSQLDPKYREPLMLQVFWGYSCQEIADILGTTRSATMTQLFRARGQLRSVLGEADSDH